MVVLTDRGQLAQTAGTIALYTSRGVRTVLVAPEELRDASAATHFETADPYDLIESYRPQVVVCHHEGPLRAVKLACYRTGIPAKLYLTARDGATAIPVGGAAEERFYRDLDRTNAPLPETDLFAGVS